MAVEEEAVARTAAQAPSSFAVSLRHGGRFLAAAVATVLAFRGLYLARFGWDGGWMNWGYLAHAKTVALQGGVAMEEPPLSPLLLVFFRHTGLGSLAALGAAYLAAHLALFLGTLGLGVFVWPDATRRERTILVLVVALTPLLSTVAGYRNFGVLVGAATLVCALALAVSAGARPRPSFLHFAGAALFALLAATARFEALAGVFCAALVLAALGGRLAGVHWPKAAALALLAGGLLGLGVSSVLRRTPSGPPDASRNYALYTFYDGLPWLLWPSLTHDPDEFGRYQTSVQYLGTFAENGGSVARALLTHPRAALLRVLTKPVDFLGALGWFGSLTPVGLVLVWLGVRGLPWRRPLRAPLPRGWVLLAYVAPLALLWVPASAPPYFLTVAPPLLLAMSRGLDRLTERLSARTGRWLVVSSVAVGALLIGLFGKRDVANSRVLNQVAAYLETRCASGCLVSFLPQSVHSQAWVVLNAGSPLPAGGRSESRVLGREAGDYARGFNFESRVKVARQKGFEGPVLYVQSDISSFQAFHSDFDSEVKLQGDVDLSGAEEERQFENGADRVTIYRLPRGR